MEVSSSSSLFLRVVMMVVKLQLLSACLCLTGPELMFVKLSVVFLPFSVVVVVVVVVVVCECLCCSCCCYITLGFRSIKVVTTTPLNERQPHCPDIAFIQQRCTSSFILLTYLIYGRVGDFVLGI